MGATREKDIFELLLAECERTGPQSGADVEVSRSAVMDNCFSADAALSDLDDLYELWCYNQF